MIDTRSWVRNTGTMQTNDPRKPNITTLRRACQQIAGAVEDAIADLAAEIVADHAGKYTAR